MTLSVRILVLSDTHLQLGADLPRVVCELADRADHVLHCGDLMERDVLTTLATLAPVTAVRGNVDSPEIGLALPEHVEVELGGVSIGMVHDAGESYGRVARLRALFPSCDLVVFGHSHMPEITVSDDGNFTIVNPGSPTQRRRAPTHTVVWLEVEAGEVRALDVVQLDEPARN